jgi:hypothetical protein
MLLVSRLNRSRAAIMPYRYDTPHRAPPPTASRSSGRQWQLGDGRLANSRARAARTIAPGTTDLRPLAHDPTGAVFLADTLGARCRLFNRARVNVLMHVFLADTLRTTIGMRIVANAPKLRASGTHGRDLSGVQIEGIFVLSRVAHETTKRPGLFQFVPGFGDAAMRMTLEVHLAVQTWNRLATNRTATRTRPGPVSAGQLPTAKRPQRQI